MTRGPCAAHAACYASQDFSSGIHTMRHLLACLALLPLAAVSIGTVHAQSAQPLTLDQVMADPDWIGSGVEDAWWSWDGKHAYYTRKRSEEHTSELQSLMRTSYAVFCLKNKYH